MNLAIDISRTKSGGGLTHIKSLLIEYDKIKKPFDRVYIFGGIQQLRSIENYDWLNKINHKMLNQGLISTIIWELFILPREFKKYNCDVILYTSAKAVKLIRPDVVMFRDMLPFDTDLRRRYSLFNYMWWRLFVLKYLTIYNLKYASRLVVLNAYISEFITNKFSIKNSISIIPHGIGKHFVNNNRDKEWSDNEDRAIRCVYVSPILMYKNQVNVLTAISFLNKDGLNVKVTFIGAGGGKAQSLLKRKMQEIDPEGLFSNHIKHVNNKYLPEELNKYDIFIFASSCENMPNILLEGMSQGMPIACSVRDPMPRILKDGGVYFNPDNPRSIKDALQTLIFNPDLRKTLALRAKEYSKDYDWSMNATMLIDLLSSTASQSKTTYNESCN